MIDTNPNTQAPASAENPAATQTQSPSQTTPAIQGTVSLQPQQTPPATSPELKLEDLVSNDGSFKEGWTSKFENADSLGKYKTVNDLINGFVNANKLIGRKSEGMTKPGEGASEEEIKAWRRHIGVPETPDGYSVPDAYKDSYDEESFKEFAKFAHQHNIPPDTAQELLKYQDAIYRKQNEEFGRQIEDASKKAQEYFQKEWGARYNDNALLIKNSLIEAGIDVNDSSFAMALNTPYILEALYEKAAKYQEGTMPTPGVMSVNANSAKQQMMEMMTKYGDITRMPPDVRARYTKLASIPVQW